MTWKFCPASSDFEVIMDDESYIQFKADENPGNATFSTLDKETTRPEVKFEQKSKFLKKFLV